MKLRETQVKDGSWVTFQVIAPSPDGNHANYQLNMFVPETRKEEFMDKLVPECVFSVETGRMTSKTSSSGRTWFEIKMEWRDFLRVLNN